MSKSLESGTFYRVLNYPPESGMRPVCPFFNQIKKCSELAGLDIKDFFCGDSVQISDINDKNNGVVSSYGSESFCIKVSEELSSQIKLVKEVEPIFDQLRLKMFQNFTPEDIKLLGENGRKIILSRKILDRFKKATFEENYGSTDDDIDDAVPLLEDIGSCEAIEFAEETLAVFQKHLGFNTYLKSEDQKPENCQISPAKKIFK